MWDMHMHLAAFYRLFLGLIFPYPFFNKIQDSIQHHSDYAQDYNGHQNPGELESLAAVDDQISESLFGGEKFTDDDADQAETDVDLHVGENQRD